MAGFYPLLAFTCAAPAAAAELRAMAMTDPPERWSVDKKIPVAAIGALAAFFIGQTWYFASQFSDIKTKQQIFEDFMKSSQPQGSQIAVIQEKVSNLSAAVQRLDDHLRVAIPQK